MFLEWMIAQGETEAMVYSDSKLLINQMTGLWRHRHGLYIQQYHRAIKLIEDKHLRLTFCWIAREQNGEADHLSKEALRKAGVQMRIQRE